MGDIRVTYIKECNEGSDSRVAPGEDRVVEQSLASRLFREGLAVPFSEFNPAMIERSGVRQARIEPAPSEVQAVTPKPKGKNADQGNK